MSEYNDDKLPKRILHSSASKGNAFGYTYSSFNQSKIKHSANQTFSSTMNLFFDAGNPKTISKQKESHPTFSLFSKFSEYFLDKQKKQRLITKSKKAPQSLCVMREYLKTNAEAKSFNNLCQVSNLYGSSDEIEDKEYQMFLDIYKRGHTVGKKKKEVTGIPKYEKNELFRKYNITKSVDPKVENALKLSIENQDFRKSGCVSINSENYFENPIKSYQKLQLNKQLQFNIFGKIGEQQIKRYLELHFEREQENLKATLMPKIEEQFLSHKFMHLKESPIKMKTDSVQHLSQQFQATAFIPLPNMSREMLFKEYNDLFATEITNFTNIPSTRSETSIVKYTDKDHNINKLFLYGGLSNERLSDIWACDLTDHYKWTKLTPQGEIPPARSGHKAVMYKKEIFIYGGIIEDETIYRAKEDILIYDVIKNQFFAETCYNKAVLKWRREHIAEAVGNHMLISGGIDEDGHFLNDTWILDFHSLRWIRTEPKGVFMPPLARHSSCLVVPREKREQSSFSIFRFPDINSENKVNTSIKIEGIYIFGGIDSEGTPHNDLYVLKIGGKPLERIQPQTSGNPPAPRYGCSMNYYEKLNMIIIHGGQNDKYRHGPFFQDFFILDVELLQWTKMIVFDKINLGSPVAQPRGSHVAEIHENSLLIFGGISEKIYLKSNLLIISLNIFENKIQKYKTAKIGIYNHFFKSLSPELKNENRKSKISRISLIDNKFKQPKRKSNQCMNTESDNENPNEKSKDYVEQFMAKGKEISQKMFQIKSRSQSMHELNTSQNYYHKK